jgi:hypothetical protein
MLNQPAEPLAGNAVIDLLANQSRRRSTFARVQLSTIVYGHLYFVLRPVHEAEQGLWPALTLTKLISLKNARGAAPPQ